MMEANSVSQLGRNAASLHLDGGPYEFVMAPSRGQELERYDA